MVGRSRIPEVLVAPWPRPKDYEDGGQWIHPCDMSSLDELTQAVATAAGVSSAGIRPRWRIEATRDVPTCLSEPDTSLELLLLFGWAYKEHGEPYFAYVELTGAVSQERFEDAYVGSYGDREEFARQHFHDEHVDTPAGVRDHIDWSGVAQDLFRDEFESVPTPGKGVFVYRRL